MKEAGSEDPETGFEKSKADVSNEELPLLFGRFSVSPQQLLRVLLSVYAVFFFVHRVADLAYLLTIDARFPDGLGHLYKSELERQESVAYTRQTTIVSCLRQSTIFCLVIALTCTRALARTEEVLRKCVSWMRACCGCRCCRNSGEDWWHITAEGFASTAVAVIRACTDACCHGCCRSCCCGFQPKWGRAFRGAVFLAVLSEVLFLADAPFKLWMYDINVRFGFVNTITVSPADFKRELVDECFDIFGPVTLLLSMVLLVILQSRYGWLVLWSLLISFVMIAQFNMGYLAPIIFDARNRFPNADFAVGRGFPLVSTGMKKEPWVSLNRIYYQTNSSRSFRTDDKSKGSLEIVAAAAPFGAGHWAVQPRGAPTKFEPYAETLPLPVPDNGSRNLEQLRRQPWKVAGHDAEDARIGVRRGKQLREEVFGFAKREGVGLGEVYMVDGSHQDARANAFVAGAGKDRVIGLYDTLFLGDRPKEMPRDASGEGAEEGGLVEDGMSMRALSELVQQVDVSEEEPRPLWHSAPTQAMTDMEIMAILGHEMGHASMKHVEGNMVVQTVTTFLTFAALGWATQSPILAASLGFATPMTHVGYFAFEHVLGPSLDGAVKLFTDGLTRRHEYQADAYAASISEAYAAGLQSALAKLVVNSNQDPDEPWFYEALHADHPSLANRWAHIEEVKQKLYGRRRVRPEK